MEEIDYLDSSSGVVQWMELINWAGSNWETKDICKSWIKTGPVTVKGMLLNWKEDPFYICKYENANLKLTQLEKQYLNKESLEQAMEAWAQGKTFVSISLVGGPKWGTAANNKHCLKQVTIHKDEKEINLYVRCSDLIKKFPTDLYFLKHYILNKFAVEDYTLNVVFDSVMLRSPFYYIYLDQILRKYGKEILLAKLNSPVNEMKSFLRYYKKNLDTIISYKSLNRAKERFEESDCYEIVLPYIKNYQL